jgi:hypothetical protein
MKDGSIIISISITIIIIGTINYDIATRFKNVI